MEAPASVWITESSTVSLEKTPTLPRIDDTLEALSGTTWLSSLDLKSGYWQVGVHPEDRENSLYNWKRAVAVSSYAIQALQCTCNLRATDGKSSGWTTTVSLSCLPPQHPDTSSLI